MSHYVGTEESLRDWDIYRSVQPTGRNSHIVNGDVKVYTEDPHSYGGNEIARGAEWTSEDMNSKKAGGVMNFDPFEDSRKSGGMGCWEDGRRDGSGGRGAADAVDVPDGNTDAKYMPFVRVEGRCLTVMGRDLSMEMEAQARGGILFRSTTVDETQH